MKARALWHTAGVVFLNAAGNFALAVGLKRASAAAGPVLSLLEPAAMAGIALLIAWMLLRLRLLQIADLSFVLPITAVGYILNAVLGAALLGEHVSLARWAGAVLITGGAALTSSTPAEGNVAGAAPSAPGQRKQEAVR
jgi:uncharacterized membrane protein